MRKLLACPACKRQYDATALTVGARFHCRCGATIVVPDLVPHEAAVVRCRACGATRATGAAACAYCGSDFTLHEQDLDTMCPACFARISDRSRYCHHCATPISPEEVAGQATERPCPACGADRKLSSRALGREGLTVLECRRCAGLWLSEEAFQILRTSEREKADPAPDPVAIRAETESRSNPRGSARLYRPCPVCATLMNRFNFGRRSGVLLDRCVTHGIWFDAAELDAAMRWIRLGGERLVAERQEREDRERASAKRFRVEPRSPDPAWSDESTGRTPDLLDWLAARLFRL